ncbi:hypothetical protein B0O80DRAFT_99470 [Mortierella sp. GBAus27b]|nr:hypothetical protein B0O80DRAFT_99470 [Mortierella sp. GBAus27b]
MSSFPILSADAKILTTYDGVHDFFNDSNVHPDNWTPMNFANYPTAKSYGDYTAGLYMLRRAGMSAIHSHAGSIIKWLEDKENSLLVEQAQLRIIEKVHAQNSELVANTRKLKDAQHIVAPNSILKRPYSPSPAGSSQAFKKVNVFRPQETPLGPDSHHTRNYNATLDRLKMQEKLDDLKKQLRRKDEGLRVRDEELQRRRKLLQQKTEEFAHTLEELKVRMDRKDEKLAHLQKKIEHLERLERLPETGITFRIEKDVFEKQVYVVQGVDVGDLFLKFQHQSTVPVNKLHVKATMDNLPKFLSMNYIMDMQDQLPGLPDEAYTEIKLQTTLPMKRLSPSEELLCSELDKEMERQASLVLVV